MRDCDVSERKRVTQPTRNILLINQFSVDDDSSYTDGSLTFTYGVISDYQSVIMEDEDG